ncbi:CPBP family intramembrane glutamic endopeptidase [Halorussus marinus]|uniref:CPBP family intramembrane glutamic endopeptidase n=1 Tax=Halorussus marinus TaxID=2505976 RepID=UPI001091931E|nr:CPBP family intramembrane glutamic endopeptidase [Halorussus marinus]
MATPPQYESFAAVTMLVLGLLVLLARASAAMFDDPDGGDDRDRSPDRDGEPRPETPATGAARIERRAGASDGWNDPPGVTVEDDPAKSARARDEDTPGDGPWGPNGAEVDARRSPAADALSTGALLANVAVSQGFFGVVVIGAAWFASIPPADLGVAVGDPWSVGPPALAAGAAVGVALYVANELSASVLDSTGVDYSESLRAHLAPETLRGWAVLLGVVLPIIAGFEELLFRAALVGAFAAGFGVSPWALAIASSVAFAVGHGAQGPGGVAVTGVLGFALAAAFVLTGSLLVVVVAHYLINALEFVIHEGLGVEWA